MKKFLRIPIAVILLLGVGLVYLVKNPGLPISQNVLTTLGISTKLQPEITTGNVGLANPASVNCENNGGVLQIITSADGSQLGMCTLANGTVCEERAYMRGECGIVHTGAQGPGLMNHENPSEGTACTEEAKVCPDRSAVGRTGPNCEFAPCPGEQTACSMIYAPVCASVAIQCIKAPCPPIEQTFSNLCVMKQNKLTTFLHDGECGIATDCPQRSQPSPDFCPNGTIVDGGKDSNGCQLPPNCATK